MGLFSSKKKRYVSTSISRVVEDSMVPNLTERSMIKAIMENKSYPEVRTEEVLNSKIIGVERAYRFARSGGYYYGTPNHNLSNSADGKDVLKNVIEGEIGKPITFDYFHFAAPNNLHIGWQKLTEEYEYDEFTNEVKRISREQGKKFYVENMVGFIDTTVIASDDPEVPDPEFPMPDAGTLAVWDRHPQARYIPVTRGERTPVWCLADVVDDKVVAYLVAKDGTRMELEFPLLEYDEDMEYFQAKYRYKDDAGVTRIGFFTYMHLAGNYPILDAVHEKDYVGQGTFMPFVVFRQYGQDRTASQYHDTQAFKSTEKLCKMIGLDFQALGDEINKGEDSHLVEQSVLMFAVPANSNNPVELKYLYQFFDWIYLQNNTRISQTMDAIATSIPGQSITIRDADFRCSLSWSRIIRTRQAGKVTKVGGYARASRKEERVVPFIGYDLGKGGYTRDSYTQEVTIQMYRYQVTATSYIEIAVENLQLRYHIYKSKGVTAEMGSSKLLIPLDYNIAKSFNNHDKEILYYRSMHMVFNAIKTVRVKWYERSIFKFVLIIVAVVITVLTGGTGGALAAAMISAGVATTVAIAIEMIILSFVFDHAFKIVIKELGADIAMVLAAVALIAGVSGYNLSPNAFNANNLVCMGSNLANAAQNAYYADKLAKYSSEYQEFVLLAEEEIKELKEIEDALNSSNLLDPFSFIGKVPEINPGESPDNLYNRTVHAGNIGTVAFDYIESYVDINLRLPDFNDLVGDTFYGRV